MTDEELMERFKWGDTCAFQTLFDQYKHRVFRYIHGTFERDPGRAEDHAQEVFLRVIKGRAGYNGSMRFSSWLFAIARNYCLNQIRGRSRMIELNIEDFEGLETAQWNKREDLETKELDQRIREAIEALPEHLRSVFVLREIDGLPHREIAEVLDLKEGNVRVQLNRAKQQLRKRLIPYLENGR